MLASPAESCPMASHYLICTLGSQSYALSIAHVQEITSGCKEKALPLKRNGILGLVAVRGIIYPLLDISPIMPSIHRGSFDGQPCMIVCEVENRKFCFNVDKVQQIASSKDFKPRVIQRPASDRAQLISHIVEFQGETIQVVEMPELARTSLMHEGRLTW